MTQMQGDGITEVLLFASGLVSMQPASDMNFVRFALGEVSNVSSDA